MDVVKNVSKEGEDFKNTEAAPLSRSESRGGDWKTQVSYNQYHAIILEIFYNRRIRVVIFITLQ